MVPPTRRHLLQTAVAVTAGLAGCGQLLAGEESSSSRSVSDGPDATVSGENRETDPDIALVRTGGDSPPIRMPDDDEASSGSDRWARQSRHRSHVIIDTRSRAQELIIEDIPDAESVSSFLSATDFEAETLYLETISVQECFRLELCSTSWSTDEVRTDYVRRTRPYDERCSADAKVLESRLIRIPASLDTDEVNSYGSSISGRGSCHGGGPAGTEGTGGGSTGGTGNATDGGTEQ